MARSRQDIYRDRIARGAILLQIEADHEDTLRLLIRTHALIHVPGKSYSKSEIKEATAKLWKRLEAGKIL